MSSASTTSASTSSSSQSVFEAFPDDIEGVFLKLCLPDALTQITPTSVHHVYNRRNTKIESVKQQESIENAFKRFHEELLGHTVKKDDDDASLSLTSADFVKGVHKAQELLAEQTESKREEFVRDMERLCLSLTGDDPKVFAELLDLPGALLTEDINAFMETMR